MWNEVSEVVGRRVREIRLRANLTGTDLARRCADLGMQHLSTATISNIETGRRDGNGHRTRTVTVDELLTLAEALNVSPVDLLVPEGDPGGQYWTTPTTAVTNHYVIAWLGGEQPALQLAQRFSEAVEDLMRMRTELEPFLDRLPGQGMHGDVQPPSQLRRSKQKGNGNDGEG